MSQDQIDALRAEEMELEEKLRRLRTERQEAEQAERKRLEEEKRIAELSKPVVVRVKQLIGGGLLTESEYRPDLVTLWGGVKGRVFKGYNDNQQNKLGRNLIPLAEWEALEFKLRGMPNLTIEWQVGVKEEMEWYLNAPPWEIDVHPDRRHFIATMGPRQSGYSLLSHIPGASWEDTSRTWKVGLSEGWRVFEALKNIEGVVYTDDAQKLIVAQVEQRTKLDQIAAMKDTDWPLIERLNRPVTARGETKPWHEHMEGFQKVGTQFLYIGGGRAIIGDETGLGKTWEFLAYAELCRLEDERWQSIIACKAANLPNWIDEIRRLTGEEPVVCKSGTPDIEIINKIIRDRAPYVLISHDTLGLYKEEEVEQVDGEGNGLGFTKTVNHYLWANIFIAAKPNLLGIDEAHKIKNPDTHRSTATRMLSDIPHIVPLTASPVLNRTEEFWPLLYMVDPDMFKSQTQFVSTYTINGKIPRRMDELHAMLRPRFIRRKKADVYEQLPPINRMTRYYDLTKDAQRRYEEVLAGIYEELAAFDVQGMGGTQKEVMSILAQITRLKQVCAADKVEYTADLAQELIEGHENGGKVLIFSQFKGTAHAIAAKLGHEAVCTVTRGPTDFVSMDATKRHELFESVRHDEEIRYIVTTEASSEGHNLEFCEWVLFNDPFWTPMGHYQCEGRAYGRLANPHPIDAYYIVADVDIERWINDLLGKKLEIVNQAVEQIEGTRDLTGSIGAELISRMRQEMWRRG